MKRASFVRNEKFAWFGIENYVGPIRSSENRLQYGNRIYDPELVGQFRNLLGVNELLKDLIGIPAVARCPKFRHCRKQFTSCAMRKVNSV